MQGFPAASKTEMHSRLRRAVDCHRAGELEAAQRAYADILEEMPGQPDAAHLLGVICRQTGDYADAERLIMQAIQGDPAAALYYVSLGDVFQATGKMENAIRCYQQALKLNPNLVEALCNLGNALREQNDSQGAVDCCRKAISLNPSLPELYNNLGLAYFNLKNYESAAACYKRAINLRPNFVEAYTNLGNVYRDEKNFPAAISQYQAALSLRPQNEAANYNLGLLFQMQQDLGQARVCYQNAIALNPANARAYNNLGKLYYDCNELEPAMDCYRQAIRLEPRHADARFNYSLALLMQGEFAEGWDAYEWRFKRRQWRKIYPHRLKGPRWDGSIFRGRRLLVHGEQGFGDVIQFIRYLPQVKSLGGEVILEVRPELGELLQNYSGVDKLVAMSFDSPPPQDYDCHIPLMSLPQIFGTRLGNIPAQIPYLTPDPVKVGFWKQCLKDTAFRIGLVWAAKPTYAHRKTCPLEAFQPLLNCSRVRIYGLQKGPAAGQTAHLAGAMENLGAEFESFADTAGAIECLDLIISVDTAVAHLAGAMGKPVWTLLPYAPDWRWMLAREDSPWYPTMRLFRQPRQGDWQSVVDAVMRKLVELLGEE